MRALQSSLLWLLCLSSFCAGSSLAQDYQVKNLATGLDEPWSIAPIGGGFILSCSANLSIAPSQTVGYDPR